MAKWPLDVTQTKRKIPAEEPKPRDKPEKDPIEAYIETLIELEIVGKEEVAMSITKIASKIYELGLYNEIVNDPVYSCR